jgi:hypothetical protein
VDVEGRNAGDQRRCRRHRPWRDPSTARLLAIEHHLEAVAGTAQHVADQELATALLPAGNNVASTEEEARDQSARSSSRSLSSRMRRVSTGFWVSLKSSIGGTSDHIGNTGQLLRDARFVAQLAQRLPLDLADALA